MKLLLFFLCCVLPFFISRVTVPGPQPLFWQQCLSVAALLFLSVRVIVYLVCLAYCFVNQSFEILRATRPRSLATSRGTASRGLLQDTFFICVWSGESSELGCADDICSLMDKWWYWVLIVSCPRVNRSTARADIGGGLETSGQRQLSSSLRNCCPAETWRTQVEKSSQGHSWRNTGGNKVGVECSSFRKQRSWFSDKESSFCCWICLTRQPRVYFGSLPRCLGWLFVSLRLWAWNITKMSQSFSFLGKGLGKAEDGISKAIKVGIKNDTNGVSMLFLALITKCHDVQTNLTYSQ